MFSELEASYIGKPRQLPKDFNDSDLETKTEDVPAKSRFMKKKNFCWASKGSNLSVFDCSQDRDPYLFTSLDFAKLYEDKSIRITYITEMVDHFYAVENSEYAFCLLVALNRDTPGSILCLVDTRLQLILKSIECPFKISCMESISSYTNSGQNLLLASEELLIMSGIVAVGTQGGLIFFVDLCLDKKSEEIEVLPPNKITFIVKQSNVNSSNYNLSAKRKSALVNDQHICFPLNNESQQKGKFIYRSQDFIILGSFRTSRVLVTALKFVPQTNTLYAGFNFGGFQFWNLKSLKLECGCCLDADLAPVIRFMFQEPENDPKNFCYTWVCRGTESCEADRSQVGEMPLTSIFLYALEYNSKEWITGYGYFYSDFAACSCKFDYQMGLNPYLAEPSETANSCLINCYTIQQGSLYPYKSHDDDNNTQDTSLALFAWEAWDEQAVSTSFIFLAIFDLNQWYQTQMPSFIEINSNGVSFCPYMGIFSLTEISNSLLPDIIYDVNINSDLIAKFRKSNNCHEFHYYPSSYSFKINILSDNYFLNATFLGLQKRCLSQLASIGPDVFIDPKEFLSNCFLSGLIPSEQALSLTKIESKRQALLTLALKNDQLPFLTSTIQQWSSGELSKLGCDCKLILNWIWSQVTLIKFSIDELTIPLFDGSGAKLDDYNLLKLNSYEIELNSLSTLLKTLEYHGTATTEQGLSELEMRREATDLIALYLRIMLWLYNCGLLPEVFKQPDEDDSDLIYPKTSLSQTYDEWRRELSSFNPSVIGPTDILTIDGIVCNLKDSVSALWKERDGNGLYPPPSIHALINVYLLKTIPLTLKHEIMLYFLLDIALNLAEKRPDIAEKIKLFPSSFALKQNLTKLVEGLWGIDHKLFDFGVKSLLFPGVRSALVRDSNNIGDHLEQRIITSLLYQDRHYEALRLVSTCNLLEINSPEKEKLYISILLRNRQLLKAFRFARLSRSENNAEELLMHFYLACEQMDLMSKVFKLPLDNIEEEALIFYLLNVSTSPNSKHLLTLYFLLTNRIIEAYRLRESYQEELEDITDENLFQITLKLSAVIDSYLSVLPKSLLSIANEVNAVEANKIKNAIKGQTEPLKVVPSSMSDTRVVASSDVILKVMEDMEDVWHKTKPNKDKVTLPTTNFHQKIKEKGLLLTQDSPFIRTPLSSARRTKPSSTLSKTSYANVNIQDQPPVVDAQASQTKDDIFVTPMKRPLVKKKSKPGSDIFDILKTPPVRSISKSKAASAAVSDISITPVSILKVKHNVNLANKASNVSPFSVTKKSISEQHSSLRFKIPEASPQYEKMDDNNKEDNVSLDMTDSDTSLKLKPYHDTLSLQFRRTRIETRSATKSVTIDPNEEHFTFSPPSRLPKLYLEDLTTGEEEITEETSEDTSEEILEKNLEEAKEDTRKEVKVKAKQDTDSAQSSATKSESSISVTHESPQKGKGKKVKDFTPTHPMVTRSAKKNLEKM